MCSGGVEYNVIERGYFFPDAEIFSSESVKTGFGNDIYYKINKSN